VPGRDGLSPAVHDGPGAGGPGCSDVRWLGLVGDAVLGDPDQSSVGIASASRFLAHEGVEQVLPPCVAIKVVDAEVGVKVPVGPRQA
jgi:hypothetical protein